MEVETHVLEHFDDTFPLNSRAPCYLWDETYDDFNYARVPVITPVIVAEPESEVELDLEEHYGENEEDFDIEEELIFEDSEDESDSDFLEEFPEGAGIPQGFARGFSLGNNPVIPWLWPESDPTFDFPVDAVTPQGPGVSVDGRPPVQYSWNPDLSESGTPIGLLVPGWGYAVPSSSPLWLSANWRIDDVEELDWALPQEE